MPTSFTYSFLDSQATLSGPGGSIPLGAGSAAADEGISVDAREDIDRLTIGADGSPMHSLVADKSAKVTVRLLKTSLTNQLLSSMLAFQRASSANWGQNTFTLVNTTSGDTISCSSVAFGKVPNLKYDKEGALNEWEFNVGVCDVALGAGVSA